MRSLYQSSSHSGIYLIFLLHHLSDRRLYKPLMSLWRFFQFTDGWTTTNWRASDSSEEIYWKSRLRKKILSGCRDKQIIWKLSIFHLRERVCLRTNYSPQIIRVAVLLEGWAWEWSQQVCIFYGSHLPLHYMHRLLNPRLTVKHNLLFFFFFFLYTKAQRENSSLPALQTTDEMKDREAGRLTRFKSISGIKKILRQERAYIKFGCIKKQRMFRKGEQFCCVVFDSWDSQTYS